MKKNIFIGIGIGIIIIGSWAIFSDRKPTPKEETEIFEEIAEKKVFLVIDDGSENPIDFESQFYEGITAFDLLEELNLTLKTKTYDVGIFIEAIGDKENGQDEKYWMYYVNGEMPMIAADKKEIKPGDKIEFKFEKSIF